MSSPFPCVSPLSSTDWSDSGISFGSDDGIQSPTPSAHVSGAFPQPNRQASPRQHRTPSPKDERDSPLDQERTTSYGYPFYPILYDDKGKVDEEFLDRIGLRGDRVSEVVTASYLQPSAAPTQFLQHPKAVVPGPQTAPSPVAKSPEIEFIQWNKPHTPNYQPQTQSRPFSSNKYSLPPNNEPRSSPFGSNASSGHLQLQSPPYTSPPQHYAVQTLPKWRIPATPATIHQNLSFVSPYNGPVNSYSPVQHGNKQQVEHRKSKRGCSHLQP